MAALTTLAQALAQAPGAGGGGMQPQDAQIQAIAQALAGSSPGSMAENQLGSQFSSQSGLPAHFFSPHGVLGINNAEKQWGQLGSLGNPIPVENPRKPGLIATGQPGGNLSGGGLTSVGPGGAVGGGTSGAQKPGATTPNPTATNPVVTNPQLPVGTMPANNGASLLGANQNNYAAKLIAQQGAPKTQEAQNALGSELANQMMAVGRPPAGGYPASANTVSSGNILAAVRLAQQAGNYNGNPLDAYAQYKNQLNLPTSDIPWDPTAGGGG